MASVTLTADIMQHVIFFVIYDCINPWTWVLRPNIAQYATVNFVWQDAIERKTFANLYLDTNRLIHANSIITPRRRGYLRSITLNVVLPKPGPLRSAETDDEKLRNNQALQATFEALLHSLSLWKATDVHPNGVKLSFEAFAPGDQGHGEERPDSPGRRLRRGGWKRRHKSSVLDLTDPECIARCPPVLVIGEVETKRPNIGRYISAMAICALLAKLPAAKRAYIGWRNSLQSSFMRDNIATLLSQIKHPMDDVSIFDGTLRLTNDSQSSSSRSGDRLSQSIRILSQRLQSILIDDIVVSDEIFFPTDLSIISPTELPRWDRLEVFTLNYPPCTPSGEWLFLPHPNKDAIEYSESEASSDDEMGDIRSRAIAAPAMRRFYIAAANAALQMPRLQHMTLVAQFYDLDQNTWHKFWYFTEDPVPLARWTSSSRYVPEDEILDCWRKVSRMNLNKELEVELSDDINAV